MLIFDCDGVLREASWKNLINAYKTICQEFDKNHRNFFRNTYEFKRWWNPDWRIPFKKLGIITKNDIGKASRIFHQNYDPNIELFKWVERILEKLAAVDQLTILSASSSSSVKKSLAHSADFFQLIVGCEQIPNLKPDPAGINYILKQFPRIQKNKTWIIGDMPVDIQAGQAAGILTCSVTWGLASFSELKLVKPNRIAREPHDLLKLIL